MAWLLALLCCVAALRTAPAYPADGINTLVREVDPIILSGSDLPGLIGKPIDGIRVFAWREGRPTAIPFQIDQRGSSGCWVWDVLYRQRFRFGEEDASHPMRDREIVTLGSGTVDDEDPRGRALLDANDELVLMARDLGERSAAPHRGIRTPLITEIEVHDPVNAGKGWAYAAYYPEAPPARSPVNYMQYDAAEKTVQSPLYRFHFSDEHMAMIHDLQVKGIPLVDRIRIRGELTLRFPVPDQTIEFSEEDIHGHTEGYIAGPVRIIKRNIAHLSLAGGLLTTPEVTCDHFYYARHAEIPVCMSIRFPVKQVSMTLTTDYRAPPFSRLLMGDTGDTASPLPDSPSLQARLRRLGTEWIAFDSDTASIISLVVIPDTVREHAYANPCLCTGQQPVPETRAFTGTETEAGFLISSSSDCPRGEHVLYGTYLISAQPYQPGDEANALRMQHRKLQTRTRRLAAEE